MRRLALLLILLASACENGHPPRHSAASNAAAPAPAAPPAAKAEAPASIGQPARDTPPADDPDLAGLSPAQRRAYALGYRDCSHGLYAPGNHLEAYRIGCAAAHDRMESGRPQG